LRGVTGLKPALRLTQKKITSKKKVTVKHLPAKDSADLFVVFVSEIRTSNIFYKLPMTPAISFDKPGCVC
jgi:hypothetical protein